MKTFVVSLLTAAMVAGLSTAAVAGDHRHGRWNNGHHHGHRGHSSNNVYIGVGLPVTSYTHAYYEPRHYYHPPRHYYRHSRVIYAPAPVIAYESRWRR